MDSPDCFTPAQEVEQPEEPQRLPKPRPNRLHRVDTYCEEHVFLWVRLMYDNQGFVIESAGEWSEGTPPSWWDAFDGEKDLYESSLDIGWMAQAKVYWALEQGITPWQPFLIQIDKPEWRVDYYGECDMIASGCVARIPPVSATLNLKCWETFLRLSSADRAATEEYERQKAIDAAAHEKAKREDVGSMYIRVSHGWSAETTAEDPPDLEFLTLCSSHEPDVWTGRQVKSETGDTFWVEESVSGHHQKAKLWKLVQAGLPHITEAQFLAMPFRWHS